MSGCRSTGGERDETVHRPSSGSRNTLPSRSDPSEAGWGRRGWDCDRGGGVSGRDQWKRGSG